MSVQSKETWLRTGDRKYQDVSTCKSTRVISVPAEKLNMWEKKETGKCKFKI